MNCFHECRSRLDETWQPCLQTALGGWLDLECRIGLERMICTDIAFPEEIIRREIEGKEADDKVLSFSLTQRVFSDEFVSWLIDCLEEGKSTLVFECIRHKPSISAGNAERLLGLLKGPKQSAIRETLKFCHIPEATINDMIKTVHSTCEESLRNGYLSIITWQRHLSFDAIQKLWEMNYSYGQTCYSGLSVYAMDTIAYQLKLDAKIIERLRDVIDNTKDRQDRINILTRLGRRPELREYFLPWLPGLQDMLEDASLSGEDIYGALRAIAAVSCNSLGRQRSIAQLVGHHNYSIRHSACDILAHQKDLREDEIKSALESASKLFPWDVARALRGRLHMHPDNPPEQLIIRLSHSPTRVPGHITSNVGLSDYLQKHLLPNHNSLPNDIVDCIVEMILKPAYDGGLASILRQTKLKPEAVSQLIEAIESKGNRIAAEALQGHPEAQDSIMGLLSSTGNTLAARIATIALMSPGSVSLGCLFDEKCISQLLFIGGGGYDGVRRQVVEVLLYQPKLPPKILKYSLKYVEAVLYNNSLRGYFGYYSHWPHRTINEFCDYAASSCDHEILRQFLTVIFLRQSHAEATPAWIDGDSLWCYDADGSKVQYRLQNERAFRERFQRAQKEAGVPEWSQISLTVGSDKPGRRDTEDGVDSSEGLKRREELGAKGIKDRIVRALWQSH